jgi:hypothetical protein
MTRLDCGRVGVILCSGLSWSRGLRLSRSVRRSLLVNSPVEIIPWILDSSILGFFHPRESVHVLSWL